MLLLLTTLLTALIAGLFYSWSCSVIPGVARLSDEGYLNAMQAMNRAILNPLFFASFLGAALVLPVCTWQQVQAFGFSRGGLVVGATVTYWIGVMGVTMLGNVPLNNMLDGLDMSSASAEKMSQLRTAFERPWIQLHQIRTVASVLALVLMILACLDHEKNVAQ